MSTAGVKEMVFNDLSMSGDDERFMFPAALEGLAVSPVAVVVGPNTPEVAMGRRVRQKLLQEDAKTLNEDCRDRVTDIADCDDQGVVVSVEEQVAISPEANTTSKSADNRRPKVTLERARAKLNIVKASKEKDSKRKKLEDILIESGAVDDTGDPSSPLGIRGKAHILKGASIERARAKLEAVKNMKVSETLLGEYRRTRSSKLSANVTRGEAPSKIPRSEEPSQEGCWIVEAKLKLHAAKAKQSKSIQKRSLKTSLMKKGSVQIESPTRVMCVDGGEDVGSIGRLEGDVCMAKSATTKKAKPKLKSVQGQARKAERFSERVASSQLRTQQMLEMQSVMEGEEGVVTYKARSSTEKRYGAQALVNSETGQIKSDLHGEVPSEKEDAQAITSPGGREMSPDVSLEYTSSVEVTPQLTKRKRKVQQLLAGGALSVGARSIFGEKWVPPASPYGLIQEQLYQDPWKVLVACMLLNKTGGRQMHKVIWDLFELCPDAETCVSMETEKIGVVIHSLGLQNKRAKMLQRFSKDYLGPDWTNVTQLHGIGEYARDAYAIFCEGRWREVEPDDHVLTKYWRWLCNTQGLGYGFSQ